MNYGAYLEDFHEIKIIIPAKFKYKDIYLTDLMEENRLIKVFKSEIYNDELHLYCYMPGYFSFRKDYYVIVNSDSDMLKYYLSLGKIIRSNRFDIEYTSDKELGVFLNKDQTLFRFYAPTCKEVIVVIDNNMEYPLSYIDKGIFELVINANLENHHYYYKIRYNLEYRMCLDPYAHSASVNFKDNIIVDLKNSYQFKRPFLKKVNNPIIYEISIRDLTAGGTFKDAYESFDTNIGFGYIKKLGITHVELLPIFGFGGVDEETKKDYNWGYNPVCYGTVSNYLTKDSNNPYGGLNELKMLVDRCHENKIGVIMDVVFNHVYDINSFSIAVSNPGYGFHTDNRGFLTNASGCGNDLNTKRKMMARFIIDMCKYYVDNYKLDGLRFDLMCLLDVELLNRIKEEVRKINPNILLLGEGWNIKSNLREEEMGSMKNFYFLDGYSFFNDQFRNNIKERFAVGNSVNNELLYSCFTGFCVDEELFNKPLTSVNYCECHDNYTFFDNLMKKKANLNSNQIIDYSILSLGCVILSSGIPFIHLGEEFLRTKKGNENSYNLSDEINKIDWQRALKYKEVVNSFKTFIKLKKKYRFFNLTDHEIIKEKITLENKKDLFKIKYVDDDYSIYTLIVKNNYDKENVYFASGNHLIFNGRKIVDENCELLELNKPGIYLFKR